MNIICWASAQTTGQELPALDIAGQFRADVVRFEPTCGLIVVDRTTQKRLPKASLGLLGSYRLTAKSPKEIRPNHRKKHGQITEND